MPLSSIRHSTSTFRPLGRHYRLSRLSDCCRRWGGRGGGGGLGGEAEGKVNHGDVTCDQDFSPMFGTGNLLRPRRPPCSGDVSCMRPRRPSLHNKHAVPSRLMPDVVPRERPGGASSACGSGHNGNAFTWFLFSDLSVGNKLSESSEIDPSISVEG